MSGHTTPTPIAIRRVARQTAEHIVTWRKLRSLTQAQVADRAGISRGTVQRLEAGDIGVSVESLLRVLRALGMLESIPQALDPFMTDIGRLRSEERLPKRVRPRSFVEDG